MHQVCKQHENRIERICLNPECTNRALCLLCDHPHGSEFRSIMSKQSQSYKKFQSIINDSIDRYFLLKQESAQEKVKFEQVRVTKTYFTNLRAQVQIFLDSIQNQILSKLNSSEEQNFAIIKQARINKNYIQIPPQIFNILLQIYQGMDISDIFKNNQQGNTEEAYHMTKKMHQDISKFMESKDFKLRLRVPDIRSISISEKDKKGFDNLTSYDLQQTKNKFVVNIIKQSQAQFQSIISDCVHLDNLLFTTSYDKKLRIFDHSFSIKSSHQYSNILTKIHCIGQDVFSLALSKQILIQNIKPDKDDYHFENIMKLKGHTERINDLHSLNTRILGSSSSEGVKIWDLYKQKCEYTLNDTANPTTIRFLPTKNQLVVGFNSHLLKIYSVQTMRLIKKYDLTGIPLVIDQGKCTQNVFYVGSFPSNFSIFDLRLAKVANQYILKADAVTCISDSIQDSNVVAVGDRGGNANIIDLRTKKIKVTWLAHNPKTHLSKPRGVVNIVEHSQNQWITIGCNDKALKLWEIAKLQ